ncbi:MAG: hypothetical protein PHP32_03555, partial [Candidatus Izemoplasmatales bacterium]|nr:hypothetical protein [Candidatus Izemoplasmatales bacterium]
MIVLIGFCPDDEEQKSREQHDANPRPTDGERVPQSMDRREHEIPHHRNELSQVIEAYMAESFLRHHNAGEHRSPEMMADPEDIKETSKSDGLH